MSQGDFVRALSDEPTAMPGEPSAPGFGTEQDRGTASAERAWCGLFAQVLRLDRVGHEDSFLDLGGDSITAMLLVAQAREAGYAVSVRDVFEFLTPVALAAVAGSAGTGAGEADGEAAGEVPVTPVIAALAGRAAPGTRYCQQMTVRVPAGLGLAPLEAALGAVADCHQMLRARLIADEQGWRLVVPPPGGGAGGVLARRVDAAGMDDEGLAAAAVRAGRAAARRLDARGGVMMQAAWLDAGPSRPGLLVVVIHHLVVDGVSWRVLLPDLAAAWQAAAAGRAPALERTGTSFRSWARLLAARSADPAVTAELPAWEAVLKGEDAPLTSRPLDPGRDTRASLAGVRVAVGADTGGVLLVTAPAVIHAGPQDVLLAALVTAVDRWRPGPGGGPLLVDVEGHGREPFTAATDLTRTVGWFTSVYPVRLDPGPVPWTELTTGGPAAGQLVKRVKEQVRAVPGNGLGYGLLRYLNPATAPVLAALTAPQIGFNYLGRVQGGQPARSREPAAGDWQPTGHGGLGGATEAELPVAHVLEASVTVRETPTGPELTLRLSAPRELAAGRALRQLAGYWTAALEGIAAYTISLSAKPTLSHLL